MVVLTGVSDATGVDAGCGGHKTLQASREWRPETGCDIVEVEESRCRSMSLLAEQLVCSFLVIASPSFSAFERRLAASGRNTL